MSGRTDIDILMITHNRPAYTRLSLPRLLETCDESMRVWVWHNGDDGDANAETLRIVESTRDHPRFHRFHHSPENRKLTEPTNWLWRNAAGTCLTKVDDDCLMPPGWADTLRCAHQDNRQFGVLGCWRFMDEDFRPEIARKKIRAFAGGHRVMRNCWVEGSGYCMKRSCVEAQGLLRPKQSFTNYCNRLAAKGWINGWYFPFLYQEHMDDPRSPRTMLKTDADMTRYLPLTALTFGVGTVAEWTAAIKRDALVVQEADPNPKYYTGWRPGLRKLMRRCGIGGRG